MPTFNFQCRTCKHRHEIFLKHSEYAQYDSDRETFCEDFECNNFCCVAGDLDALITAPAIIGGDKVQQYGVNGTFNRGLGCMVYSDRDLREKAAAKGLVLASDAGISSAGWSAKVDDQFNADIKAASDHETAIAKIKDGLDTHKDEGRAIAEAFSVDVMKESGNLNEKYDAAG
tara:strand:- start:456 stop:974 length:519 start_codon:yes stop_codon:yes gene_type:complete